MIPWWIAVLTLIVGEVFGVIVMRFCTMNDELKSKYIK